MEHHVVLEKICSCAKKHGVIQILTCKDKDEAYEQALELAAKYNDSFCGKHGFDVEEVDEHYVISVETGGFVEACEI